MPQNFQQILTSIFDHDTLIQATFSNPRKKSPQEPSKVTLRPVQVKQKLFYQISTQVAEKVLHRNVNKQECQSIILDELLHQFKQGVIYTTDHDYHLLINRAGEATILTKAPSKSAVDTSHNRPKQYIISEGTPLPFLVELGLMNAQGKVYPQKMDKFRQINRFLEMVSDVLPSLAENKQLRIIDFGCGKAYLTFALYYFLHEVHQYDVIMTGLDLKEDVIKECQRLAKTLGYKNLDFCLGDIANYTTHDKIDMVVALHACDTATDKALEQAIRWKAKVILAAPCCQHELFTQVRSTSLEGILHYGILKERFSALATDAVRAQILEMCGYKTQILEFIDSEHTPKNLLIRAVLGNSAEQRELASQRFQELKNTLNTKPYLERILKE